MARECWVCLDEGGETVHAGCACRGTANGYIHLECLSTYASTKTAGSCEPGCVCEDCCVARCYAWTICPTCRQGYSGPVATSLAQQWFRIENKSPPDNPQRQEAALWLAGALYGSGYYEQAIDIATDLLTALNPEAQHEFWMATLLLVAELHQELFDWSTALVTFQSACGTWLRANPQLQRPTKPELMGMHVFGRALAIAGAYERALAVLRPVVELKQKHAAELNIDRLSILESVQTYAKLLTELGDTTESVKLHQQAHDGIKQLLGPTHRFTRHVARTLETAKTLHGLRCTMPKSSFGRLLEYKRQQKVAARDSQARVPLGRLVGLTGSRADLNGVEAKIIAYCELRQRYGVRPQYRPPRFIKGPWLQPSQTPPIILVRAENITLPIGATVTITGLQQATELNGRRGRVELFSAVNFRYKVKVHNAGRGSSRQGRPLLLKPEHCLMLVPRYRRGTTLIAGYECDWLSAE